MVSVSQGLGFIIWNDKQFNVAETLILLHNAYVRSKRDSSIESWIEIETDHRRFVKSLSKVFHISDLLSTFDSTQLDIRRNFRSYYSQFYWLFHTFS